MSDDYEKKFQLHRWWRKKQTIEHFDTFAQCECRFEELMNQKTKIKVATVLRWCAFNRSYFLYQILK